jgi:hypothetical protein
MEESGQQNALFYALSKEERKACSTWRGRSLASPIGLSCARYYRRSASTPHRDTIKCTTVAILRCLLSVTHIVIGLSCRMKTRTPTLYRIYATMKKENHHLLLLSHLLLQSLLTPNILLHSSIHHLILTLDTTGSTLTTMLTLTSNNNLHRLPLLTLTRSSHDL